MTRRRDIDPRGELEELFADLWQVPRFAAGMRRAHRPQIDVFGTKDPPELNVVVELPGADPEKVHVVLDGRRVRIFGERPRVSAPEAIWYRSEIEYGAFERELALTVDVDAEQARATYEAGLLKIVLPVAQRPPRPSKVPIQVERTT